MKVHHTLLVIALTVVGCTENGRIPEAALTDVDPRTKDTTGVAEKHHDVQYQHNALEVSRFMRSCETFTPQQIDISSEMDSTLSDYDLEWVSAQFPDSMDLACEFLLLNTYLSHLKEANQSYDLLQMRKGRSKWIIDHYLRMMKLPPDLEMVSSGYPYETLIAAPSSARRDQRLKRLISRVDKAEGDSQRSSNLSSPTGESANKRSGR